jgi:hypothetical protein
VIVQPHPTRAAAIAAQQIGRHAAFVDKHIPVGVVRRLPLAPESSLRGDISAALFVGVYRFFKP